MSFRTKRPFVPALALVGLMLVEALWFTYLLINSHPLWATIHAVAFLIYYACFKVVLTS